MKYMTKNTTSSHDLFVNVVNSPEMYPDEIDFQKGLVRFCRMSRETYALSPWLDERKVAIDDLFYEIEIDKLLADFSPGKSIERPVHFIFQTSHAGSTLLARALDALDGCFSLKEPFAVLQAAAAKRHPQYSELIMTGQWQRFIRMIVGLMSRTFSDNETALIKTTSVCHNLMPDFLCSTRSSRGLFLYSGLERYLTSVYKHNAVDKYLRGYFDYALHDLVRLGVLDRDDANQLPLNRKIALLWLSVVFDYHRFLEKFPDAVIYSLDCDHLFKDPAPTLQAVAGHFGFPCDDVTIRTVAESPLFRTNAKKINQNWDMAAVEKANAEVRKENEKDIKDALYWAEGLASYSTVLQSPGRPLTI